MEKISVIVNTLNEEKNLSRALSSVKDFAYEIIVVDMKSDDDTQKIAKKYGAKVYEHKRTNYVEPARNYAIGKATGDWILVLDADEEIPHKLANLLKKTVDNPKANYFRIPRKNIIFGKWIKHSHWWPDYNIRFFMKGSVIWSEIIHSVPETHGKGLDIETKEENAIVHHNYDSVEQYIDRLNRYTTEHAKNIVKEGYIFKWTDLIKKPTGEFLRRYFQGDGYKDGVHGLALAGLQSFSELVLYLKIWQSGKFKKNKLKLERVVDEMKNAESELHYWQADTLIREVGGIRNRIKRKFRMS